MSDFARRPHPSVTHVPDHFILALQSPLCIFTIVLAFRTSGRSPRCHHARNSSLSKLHAKAAQHFRYELRVERCLHSFNDITTAVAWPRN
jgi:hypothetical protein